MLGDVRFRDVAGTGARAVQERAPGPTRLVDDFFGEDLIVVAVVGFPVTDNFYGTSPSSPNPNDLIPLPGGPDGHCPDSRI